MPRTHLQPLATLSLFLACLGLTLLSAAALADDGEGQEASLPLRSGIWAAQFEVLPQYSGSSFGAGGYTISLKRHFTERSALRATIGVTFDERSEEGDHVVTVFDSTATANTDRYEKYSGYVVSFQFQRFAAIKDRVGIFWAVGPMVHWNVSEYGGRDAFPAVAQNYSQYRADIWAVGVAASIGFEWFFISRVSLGSRVGVEGSYGWLESTRQYYYAAPGVEQLDRTETDGHVSEVRTTAFVLALSAYF